MANFDAQYAQLKAAVVSPATVSSLYSVVNQKLGSGAFGSVYPGTRRTDNGKVAVKYVSPKFYENAMQRYEALREPYILQIIGKTKCPHLLQLYSAHEEVTTSGSQRLIIVTEMASGGELFDRLTSISHYSEKDAAKAALALFEALQASHDAGVVHRDLKPENILLRSKPGEPGADDLVVADFGLSLFIGEQTAPKAGPVGTYAYMSPEIWLRRQYSTASDVWALGVLLYILLAGFPPFWAGENNDVKGMMANICAGRYEFYEDAWGDVSAEAKDLVTRMLTVDPLKRITLKQALAHPWFSLMQARPPSVHLSKTINKLRGFNARRKLRAAAITVMFGAAGMRAAYQEVANILGGRELEQAQIAALTAAFSRAAGAGSAVEFPAFCKIMEEVGLNFEPAVLNRMFLAFDRNFSGSIDFRELVTGLATLSKGDASSLRLMFNLFDADGSGFISKSELGTLLASTGFFDLGRQRQAEGSSEADGSSAAATAPSSGAAASAAPPALRGAPGTPLRRMNSAEIEDAEEMAALERVFARMDANADNKISFDEFKAAVMADSALAHALMRPLQNIGKGTPVQGMGAAT